MYNTYTDYNVWKNLEVKNGRKFFTCDIANDFKFTYWVFVAKELENKRG